MNKDEFLNKLNKNLKYLNKKDRKELLEQYKNEDTTNLNPIEEANKIYKERNLKYKIKDFDKFIPSVETIINNSKIIDIILFLIYCIILVILLKIPFIYVRDMISNIFYVLNTNTNYHTIWGLIIEGLYAISSFIVVIYQIEYKAYKIKESNK